MNRNIREELLSMEDSQNRKFLIRLLPTVSEDRILGIRTPILRKYAKELYKSDRDVADLFLGSLPHRYFDENNLHAFLIEQIPDFTSSIRLTEEFLPFIDNWATCDSFSPKVFKKYPAEVYERILRWLESKEPYTVRFGIGLLLSGYLDEYFEPSHLSIVSAVDSDEYYVRMMIAWYLSVALVKRYETVLPYFTERRLDLWIHNKAIQKALESRRIPVDRKIELRNLKILK